jgi:hypothetical protein
MRDVRSEIQAREARTRGEPPAKEAKPKASKEAKPEADAPDKEAGDDGSSDT